MKSEQQSKEKLEQTTNSPEASDALSEKLAELNILQESVQEFKKKAESYYDQLVRLTADFENYRKRTEQNIKHARLLGKEEILEKILALSDALQQAAASLTPQTPPSTVLEGLKLLSKEMDKTLQGAGIEPIKTEHQMFDPNFHEAVDRVNSDKPEGTILEEIQRGYMFDGRVLRHAKVRVAAPNAAQQ